MRVDPELDWKLLAHRYDLTNQAEWQKLLRHFKLAEGFSLVVLLVTEGKGAALCRRELEKELKQGAKQLLALDLPTPVALRELPERLLSAEPPADAACLWVEAVAPDYSRSFTKWRDAWRNALGRLNSYRNPLRERFRLALTFVGAPWLQEVLREIAPDLWSVRTLVARIEPQARPRVSLSWGGAPEAFVSPEASMDPGFALQEAEKFRGVPEKEPALARLLNRAGVAFAKRNNWAAAEKALAEALELRRRTDAPLAEVAATMQWLASTYVEQGRLQEALRTAEEAAKIAHEIGDRYTEGAALAAASNALLEMRDIEGALEVGWRLLAIAQQLHDPRNEANTLLNLGVIYAVSGDLRKAIEFYDQALAIYRKIGYRAISERTGEVDALNGLGNTYYKLGDVHKAINFYEHALEISQQIGDQTRLVQILRNLGASQAAAGNRQEAINCYRRALAVLREVGDRRGEGIILAGLGGELTALKEWPEAINVLEQALPILRETGDRGTEATSLGNLGLAYGGLGDQCKAGDYQEQALDIFREIHDRAGEAKSLDGLGHAYYTLGDAGKAIRFYEQALEVTQSIGDRKREGEILGNLAASHAAAGHQRKAIDLYRQALAILQEMGDRRGEGIALAGLGRELLALGEMSEAIKVLEQALPMLREPGDRYTEAVILVRLGRAYAASGDAPKVAEYYQQAALHFPELEHARERAWALWNWALLLERIGRRAEAISLAEAALEISERVQDPMAAQVRAGLAQWRNA